MILESWGSTIDDEIKKEFLKFLKNQNKLYELKNSESSKPSKDDLPEPEIIKG